MTEFVHQRHKTPQQLQQPRELVLVCAPLRSNVNFSRIVRAAGCFGVAKVVICGPTRLDREIARIDEQQIQLERHRSLLPVLRQLRSDRYTLIGLEQTTNSTVLYEHRFARRTALVVGNERTGLADEALQIVDAVVEIPVYGLPYAHNVATAAAIALYEYARQFPNG
jgi:tRNA G18 (ribose-2'-O)-methylase SpoU